jgi:hypothetical protein
MSRFPKDSHVNKVRTADGDLVIDSVTYLTQNNTHKTVKFERSLDGDMHPTTGFTLDGDYHFPNSRMDDY